MRYRNPLVAERNDLAIKLRRSGKSFREIAAVLGLDRSTIANICRNIEPEIQPDGPQCPRCVRPVIGGASMCWNCMKEAELGPKEEKMPEPTRDQPGTHGKIEELKRRYERGESLWNSDDRTDYDGMVGGVKGSIGHPLSGMGRRSYEQTATTDTHVCRKDLGNH